MNEIMIISIAIAAFLLFHEAMPRTAKGILWFSVALYFGLEGLALVIAGVAIWWAVNDDEEETTS